jgi:3-isopropylmalate/(R)-2-methylmalate dehydratase small subunit
VRLCDEISTGDDLTVDLDRDMLINHTTGKEYQLQPLGDAGEYLCVCVCV